MTGPQAAPPAELLDRLADDVAALVAHYWATDQVERAEAWARIASAFYPRVVWG